MLKAIEESNKGNIKRPQMILDQEPGEKAISQRNEGKSLAKRGQTPLKRETIHHFEHREKLSETAETATRSTSLFILVPDHR